MVYYDYKMKGLFPVEPQIAGEHLQKVKEKNGHLSKENVLESGRPDNSPIHSCFEWDNEVAGEKYRIFQAGMLINNVVEVKQSEEKENRSPAFVNVSENRKGQYISTKDALSQEETREIVLKRAIKELKYFQIKYEKLSELAGVFKEIDKLEGFDENS